MSLVVFSGDLDKAMASLIIANGALAMGSKVTVFFTFWGLNLLRKPNGASPAKPLIDAAFGFMLPKGVGKANHLSNMNFLGAGGRMMRKLMHDKHVEDPVDLLASLVSGGATLVACQMSMDVMGLKREEMIDGVEIGGVATFLNEAKQSGTTLVHLSAIAPSRSPSGFLQRGKAFPRAWSEGGRVSDRTRFSGRFDQNSSRANRGARLRRGCRNWSPARTSSRFRS